MKTEQDVIAAVDALKQIIDKLMADLNDIEKKQVANQDDTWMYEGLEYDKLLVSYQIAFKKERLKALEWVLGN